MKTILIVDDTEDYADNLRFVLSRAGYNVIIAVDGVEGVEKAIGVKPDLILMDVLMPGLDGVETTIRIKEQDALKAVPILFLTAVTSGENVIMSVKGQDYPAISKMADHQILLSKIQQYVESDQ